MSLEQDRNLSCRDCHRMFVWSASDQQFYAERNYSQPKRCPECRQRKREERERDGR